MSGSAAPAAAERAPVRELNPSDMRQVADTIPDDAFDFADGDDDSPSSDHASHERGDDLSPAERAAADDLPLDEEPAERPRKREKRPQNGDEAEEPAEGEGTDEGRQEGGDGEEGSAADDDGANGERQEAKPDRINLRDDATIVIDGHEVTGADVKRGFLRQADYTRKTQEVAAERLQVQQLRQQLDAQGVELSTVLDLATAITRDVIPQPPDLRQYDTGTPQGIAAFIEAQQKYQHKIAGLEQLVQSRQTAVSQQTAQQQAQQRELEQRQAQQEQEELQQEVRLMQEKIPQLRTREGWNTFYADVDKYGKQHGVTAQHAAGIKKTLELQVLMAAVKMWKLEAAKPAVVRQAQAAPPIRPAARQASGTRAADPQRSAQEAFRRNPTARTAAATLPDSWFD